MSSVRHALDVLEAHPVGGMLLAVVRGLTAGVVIAAIVLLFGSLQNGLIWNHITPQGWNDWGVIGLAVIAGLYGLKRGLYGQLDEPGAMDVDRAAGRFEGALDRFWGRIDDAVFARLQNGLERFGPFRRR